MGASCSIQTTPIEESTPINLLSNAFNKEISLSKDNLNFLVDQYIDNNDSFIAWINFLTKTYDKTKAFNNEHLESIILALRHDTNALINESKFDEWLTSNHDKILSACEKIREKAHLDIAEQSEVLHAVHHTVSHGLEVNHRSNHLFMHLGLSSTNSLRDNAYSALRGLIIELHDIKQNLKNSKTGSHEVLSYQIVRDILASTLTISLDKEEAIYTQLDVMTQRYIVLGTTTLFSNTLADLSELYLKTKAILRIKSPYEAINQEMLIVGLCDKSPAYCYELISQATNKSFPMLKTINQVLTNRQSLLKQFFSNSRAIKPYPKSEENFICLFLMLSPHIAMSIEKKISSPHPKSAKAMTYNDTLLAQIQSFEEAKIINKTQEQALLLRTYIMTLKQNVWKNNATPDIGFYWRLVHPSTVNTAFFCNAYLSDVLSAFEDIFIKGLYEEHIFSKKIMEQIKFIQGQFKGQLEISDTAPLSDSQNSLKLFSFYDSLRSPSEKLQLMHELLMPLVFQYGEFVAHELKNETKATLNKSTNETKIITRNSLAAEEAPIKTTHSPTFFESRAQPITPNTPKQPSPLKRSNSS